MGDFAKDKDVLISRQAAIDAIIPAMVEGADAELIEGILYLLPSAEPERYMVTMAESIDIDRLKGIITKPSDITLIPLPKVEPESCEYWDAESKYCALNRPSAELERKKGKWDTFFSDSYKVHEIGVECSCCGYRTKERTNFCPNCGAEMKGGAE